MLTDSQRKTYHVIADFIKKKGYSPKLPEIAKGLGIRSVGVVHRYVQALIKAGWITKEPHAHRGIKLTSSARGLPLLGAIAAGRPLEVVGDTYSDHVDIQMLINHRGRFGIKAPNNTLQSEGILKGDILIIEPNTFCSNRKSKKSANLWAILLDGKLSLVKRLVTRTQNRITVWPASPPYSPITYAANRIQIQGSVVGLIRLPR